MNLQTYQDQEACTPPQKSSPLQAAENRSGSAQNLGTSNPSLSWTIWPMRDDPVRSVVVVIFLGIVVWAIASWFGRQWIFPSIIILFLFLAGFFLPTYYRLDKEAVSVRSFLSTKKRAWAELKKYHVSKKGVHLSLPSQPAMLKRFRGLYLPFGKKREQILRYIEERMKHGR